MVGERVFCKSTPRAMPHRLLSSFVRFFLQKALGAVVVGLLFGGCLLYALFMLNRKFSREENVVQVSAVRYGAGRQETDSNFSLDCSSGVYWLLCKDATESVRYQNLTFV